MDIMDIAEIEKRLLKAFLAAAEKQRQRKDKARRPISRPRSLRSGNRIVRRIDAFGRGHEE